MNITTKYFEGLCVCGCYTPYALARGVIHAPMQPQGSCMHCYHKSIIQEMNKCEQFSEAKYLEYLTPKGQIKKSTPQNIKNEIFVAKSISKHGDLYDYSKAEYTKVRDKTVIICPIHGDFEQTIASHLGGRGCGRCKGSGSLKTTEDFIRQANTLHNYRYEYTEVQYLGATTKVSINCPEHGTFEQAPYMHTSGRGCPSCASRSHDVLYLLTDGKYYKVGIATNSADRRRLDAERNTNKAVTIVAEIKVEDPKGIERDILQLPYSNPYKNEIFNGHTEWRDIPNIDKIIERYFTT